MTEPQPTVSSLRVDKPGRSKFTPVIGGERRKASEAQQHKVTTLTSSPSAPLTPARTTRSAGLDESPVVVPQARKQTAIEAVAARRERRKSVTQPEEASSLSVPPSAATLPTLNFTPSGGKLTISHFLKDTGSGLPMTSSTAPGGDRTPKPISSSSKMLRGGTPTPLPARSVATAVVPQVRYVNGVIVVDEDAAAITATPTAPPLSMDVINESGRHLTSHAFVKSIGNNRWSRQDTDLFHEALSMCGTDFALISLLFPKRTREQVKGKFKIEERANPGRVALSLKRRKPLDTVWLERAQSERREGQTEGEEEEEKKPGRPKQDVIGGGLDRLKQDTSSSSPTKALPPVQPTFDLFASSPRKSPRIAAAAKNKQQP